MPPRQFLLLFSTVLLAAGLTVAFAFWAVPAEFRGASFLIVPLALALLVRFFWYRK